VEGFYKSRAARLGLHNSDLQPLRPAADCGRPGWWILLMLIPLVNIVIAILVAIDVAKAFGQSAAWGVVLLFLLCGIGYLILGFGNYRYVGPGGLMRSSAAAG